MTSSDVLTVSEIAEVTSEVLTWLSDSVNETAGSSTTSDSETTVLIEVSDSDAEVSEVDASEIISVSETFDDTVVLSDTSDGATETIVLVVSETRLVLAWLSDSVKEATGSTTACDSEIAVVVEIADSEVDATELFSVSDASDDTVTLSDTSDETVEAAVLAASEAGVVIESDATVPWSVLDTELSSFLSCAVSDTAIATGTAAEFTNSSTDGAGLVVSSSLGASTDGLVSVGDSESLVTVVFSDLAVSELASDVTVLSAFLPAWLVTGFKITGSTGVAVVSSLI